MVNRCSEVSTSCPVPKAILLRKKGKPINNTKKGKIAREGLMNSHAMKIIVQPIKAIGIDIIRKPAIQWSKMREYDKRYVTKV